MGFEYEMYNYKCLNGGVEMEKVFYTGEDVLTLTHEYYGFRAVKIINGDKEYTSVTNGMFCVDGLTKEITFETSWLACNGRPEIEVKDLLVLTKLPLKLESE